jgi:hypothetical protein
MDLKICPEGSQLDCTGNPCDIEPEKSFLRQGQRLKFILIDHPLPAAVPVERHQVTLQGRGFFNGTLQGTRRRTGRVITFHMTPLYSIA